MLRPAVTPYRASRPMSRMASVVVRGPAGLHVADTGDRERFQPQIEAARDCRQPVQLAGHADARQRVGFRDRRPQGAFVLAAGVALEVHAPDLRVARHEPHRAERNLDLGGPALIVDARRRVPHAVPVAVDVRGGAPPAAFAFVEDLLFELGAKRRGQEHVAVARIVEGVEDHLKVVFVEQPIGIPPHFGGADGKRPVGANADIEVTFVVEDANLGAIGGG